MENKNKAEEIKKIETLLEVLNEHGSFIDLSDAFDRNTELCVLEAMGRYLQSEIDELTKEVERLRKEKMDFADFVRNYEGSYSRGVDFPTGLTLEQCHELFIKFEPPINQ